MVLATCRPNSPNIILRWLGAVGSYRSWNLQQRQLHLRDFFVKHGAEAERRNLVSREPTCWRRRSLKSGVVRLTTGYRLRS